ncbi:MAG: hypothetical protein AB1393_14155 [Candidatus Edwardsbacteria bacterium]
MSIKIGRFWVAYESVTMAALDPEYLCLCEDEIREYIAKRPMPEDPHYSAKDLVDDLTKSSGFYCVPDDTKEETKDYIEELLNELVK